MGMLSRRTFLASAAAAASSPAQTFTSNRPDPQRRAFRSDAVEAAIVSVKRRIADPELAWMFENCFPNTLDTTVRYREPGGQPDTFVITGDIPAMWLRDSSAQVWPYLPLAKDDPRLKRLLAGVVRRQTKCILIDPYANAFNDGPADSPWSKDLTAMKPELHERKWEIDSLCFPIRLAHGYWQATGDASCFDRDWRRAAALILRTFREQQRLKDRGPYKFQRISAVASDSLPNGGYGNPGRPCGLIHSGFRPSDDACIFPYLVPSNLFAQHSLEQLGEIHATVLGDQATARECAAFAQELREAIARHCLADHPVYGRIYAYEVDGYGGRVLMDDANAPSLMSLSYIGCVQPGDPVYRNTRRFALSEDDMYFYNGKAARGLGGPHSGLDMIWPLGLILQAITSDDDREINACLAMLKATHAGTGFMHESFHKDDPAQYTRKWFAWANTMFGELILKLYP
ncbi:MAG: glycoside hydrolase family 125 protein [Acidobacteriota bacterium]